MKNTITRRIVALVAGAALLAGPVATLAASTDSAAAARPVVTKVITVQTARSGEGDWGF